MSSAGEYVAPERIEGTIKKASVVQQIFVHGNSFESCVIAVVVPDEKTLRCAHQTHLPHMRMSGLWTAVFQSLR